jgi:hypothetical protein
MKKQTILIISTLALALSIPFAVLADHHEIAAAAEPPDNMLVQLYACNLSEGKNSEDMWSELNKFGAHLSTMQNSKVDRNSGSFVWIPMIGATSYDFVLGFAATDFASVGNGMSEYMSHPDTPARELSFERITDKCVSAVMQTQRLRMGAPIGNKADGTPAGIVDTYQCTLNDRKDMDDVAKYNSEWVTTVDGMGEGAQQYGAQLWVPVLGGTGTSDYVFVGTTPDLKSYMNAYGTYLSSEEGLDLEAKGDKISTCLNNSWLGYWLVVPEARK